jgi:uncharacterized protein (DUF2249 family)
MYRGKPQVIAANFLCRVDRLIAVLINDYFPYYSMWPLEEARPSQDLVDLMEEGYELWKGAIFRRQEAAVGSQKWMVFYKKK